MPSTDKLQVSSSTLDTNTTLPPELQDQLKAALLHSGGIRAIEASLRDELARAGWTDNLRKHVQELMRSGQALRYNDIMAQLESDFAAADEGTNGAANGANGVGNGATKPAAERLPEDGGIKVPDHIVKKGIQVTRQEIEKVADVKEDE